MPDDVKMPTMTLSDVSILIPLRNGNRDCPLNRGLLPAYGDPDRARRRAWLEGMVRATAAAGFGEIVWGQVWGVPPGLFGSEGNVPEGQCRTLLYYDGERHGDLRWANDLAKSLGIARRTAFEGIGRPTSILRKILTVGISRWKWPDALSVVDHGRFVANCMAAQAMGCTGLALDSLCRLHNETGEGRHWQITTRSLGLELLGEGLTTSASWLSKMMWADQIDRSGFAPAASRDVRVRHVAVIDGEARVEPGGEQRVRTPEQAVRCAERFRAAGWSICFGGVVSAAQVEGLSRAVREGE